MKRRLRLISALLSSPLLAFAVVTPQSDAARLSGPRSIPQGVREARPIQFLPTRTLSRAPLVPDTQLSYGGGPVLLEPHIYVAFWGFKSAGDPNGLMALMKSFYGRLGGSKLEHNLTQYYGPGHKFISDKRGWLKGAWADNANPIPAQPTDAQVAAEAASLMNHFGGFDPNGAYIVQTAHGHSSSGFGSSFCSYHSTTTIGSALVPYINLPYVPDAGPNCGANIIGNPNDETAADEGATIVAGAELDDVITDPQPPSGWTASGAEISSLCAWTNIQNDPFGKKSYTSQPELDNRTGACTHAGP